MKLRLHWAERYEVVREFPTFELDSKEYPELELEMLQVHNAGSLQDRNIALADLEYKMRHTPTERGEAIFSMVEPYTSDTNQAVVHTIGDEDCGSFQVTEDE
jgi:hypothetical protein